MTSKRSWPVALTPAAADDLDEAFAYVAERNRLAALKSLARIEAAVRRLGEFPEMGALLSSEEYELLQPGIRFVVVDEVHAFVESERGVHLRCLLDRIDLVSGRKVQRIGLSATVGNPEEVLAWLSGPGRSREVVRVPVPARAKKFTFSVEPDEARRVRSLVRVVTGKKAIVFVNSRSDAEKVIKSLKGRLDHLAVHHSSLSPEMRREAESAFTREGSACIVCTSSLELGIDIGDLDVVVQLGPPGSVSSFLQRMGRSGRRGTPPYVAFILRDSCELLCTVAVVECASRKEVELLIPHARPYNVLVQQLLLSVVREWRISERKLVMSLQSLTPFQEIPAPVIRALVRHLKDADYLVSDGEMLMPGPKAEKEFGQANWKDLYSVIQGGGELRAVTPDGEVVGRLDARFVSSKNSTQFQLGGKDWKMISCDEARNRVVVVPGTETRGGIFWTGGEHGYSPVVCRGVSRVIRRGRSSLPVPEDAAIHLLRIFSKFPRGIQRGDILARMKEETRAPLVSLVTFRDSNFGTLFSHLLHRFLPKSAQISNHEFSLLIRGGLGKDPVGNVAAAAEESARLSREEVESVLPLPSPEGWKFGSLLPPAMFREMVLSDTYHTGLFMEELAKVRVKVPGDLAGNGDTGEPVS